MSAFIGNDRANLDGVLIARNWRLSSNDWEKPESPIPGKCLWNKEFFYQMREYSISKKSLNSIREKILKRSLPVSLEEQKIHVTY